MRFTYYLFNENVKDFSDIIVAKKINEDNNYIELKPKRAFSDFECRVYIQKNKTRQPKWIKFLEEDLEIPNKEEIKNTVNSFVILIKILSDKNPRFFAVTGGFGFTAINRNNLEGNFGLRVALNAINKSELKALDVRNIDLKTKQKRVMINKGSELGEFELDFDQDLINLVSGKSVSEEIGTTIKGSTASLNLNSDITFSKLGEKCKQILGIYLSDDYKENFGFIDNVKSLKDQDTISNLNNNLFEALSNRETDRISLAYPDMIEYEKCSSYTIQIGRCKIETEELVLNDLYNLLDKIDFDSPDKIKKIKVIGFDEAGMAVTHAVTLNHFIVFETELENRTYIFSLNNWYQIDKDYFETIQKEIMNIPIFEEEEFLTVMQEGESEGDYNKRQDDSFFLCLDKDNFQIQNSRSKIEICDLLSRELHFVCVKKDTRSATLSHLFSQGSVSMQLLRDSLKYMEKVVEKYNEKFPESSLERNNFPYNRCKLIYGISTSKPGDIREVLPFFSKVNLLHHEKLVNRLGIKVALYKIPVIVRNY